MKDIENLKKLILDGKEEYTSIPSSLLRSILFYNEKNIISPELYDFIEKFRQLNDNDQLFDENTETPIFYAGYYSALIDVCMMINNNYLITQKIELLYQDKKLVDTVMFMHGRPVTAKMISEKLNYKIKDVYFICKYLSLNGIIKINKYKNRNYYYLTPDGESIYNYLVFINNNPTDLLRVVTSEDN